jgi:hypothetical protein
MNIKVVSRTAILGIVMGCTVASAMTASASPVPSAPISGGGVTPYLIPGKSPSGNRTCAEVGAVFFNNPSYYKYSSERIDSTNLADMPHGLGFSTDGKFVSFSSTFGIGAVIVKGGSAANVYVYQPQRSGDVGLVSPINASGQPADLSNITFCWNPGESSPELPIGG